MEKDDISLDNYHDKTENLDDTINSIEILDEKEDIKVSEVTNQNHEYDGEFEKLVKKRDYKGLKHDTIDKKKNHPRKRLKKWVYILLLVLILGLGFGGYKIVQNNRIATKKAEEKKIIVSIKNHYNQYIKVSNDTNLLEKNGSEYQKIGIAYKDSEFELEDIDISINTKYFKIKDLDYYLSYKDVEKVDTVKNDNRYQNYLPFNINIITKDNFTLMNDDEKFVTLNKEMEFPVIINNYDNKYYVEYNNRLLAIKKDDVSKTVEKENTKKKNQSRMTTFAYHRVYDTNEKCTDSYICLKKDTFDKQMKYLSENNYFTLNLKEMYLYLKGNLQIEKGVVITFDDGYLFKSADEVLDKYSLNGTMFVISGDFSEYDQFQNLKAIYVESHTHKMHKNYVCPGGNQGGKMLCSSKEAIITDLKTSFEALKITPFGFAYPFYDYNDAVISALKEAGIKIAFVGRAGVMGRATPKVTDVYKTPRMTVYEESLMSFNAWKGYL